MILALLLLTSVAASSEAALRTGTPPEYLRSLACRVVGRSSEGNLVFPPIADVSLNTTSERAEDYSFNATLAGGKVLTSRIRHVYVNMPRDRFNVTILLDGKPLVRMNHIDLDIYIETTIDGSSYALHCFGDIR